MRTLLRVAMTLVALAGTGWSQTPGPTAAPQSPFVDRLRQADKNGDGIITVDEARSAHLWFKKFDSADTDRGGTVTVFELGQALQQRLSRWLSDFDAADANHDGQVTEDEAARAPSVADVFTTIGQGKHHAVNRQQYESYATERVFQDSELPSVAPNIFEKRF